MDARTRAVESIEAAKVELDRALAEIDRIRTFDPSLIAVVAHALSNYITITSATIEMLQHRLRSHEDRDVAIWLEGIAHAADLMQHTVGRLVSLSAPAEMPLKLDYVNLPVLMERSCHYYRGRTAEADLQIACQPVGDVPLVWGDRVALAVIADNLLSNAVRASRPHGTIRVQIMVEPGHVVCSVCDEGPGVGPEQRERLFQLKIPTLEASGMTADTGIGLAVAHEFVLRMDGELWCDSEPGHGACFSFRLPAAE